MFEELVNCECPKCGAKFQVPLKDLTCARCPQCKSFEFATFVEEKEKKE
jgi:predicted Zn-ribbon and HTH transcriptional regulator